MVKRLFNENYSRQDQLGALSEIYGHIALIVKSHTENDTIGNNFQNWSTVNFNTFISVVQPQIEWMYENSIPYDISCTHDFVNWAIGKSVSGTPLLQWFIDKGCTLSTRAHASSSKNAVDAAFLLDSQGIEHNRMLGTADDLHDWIDDDGNPKSVAGEIYTSYYEEYDLVLGTAPLDESGEGTHYGIDSFPAQIYRPIAGGQVIVLNGGNDSYIEKKTEIAQFVSNGTLPFGLCYVMSNIGRLANYSTRIATPSLWPNAGPGDFMHTPINTHDGPQTGAGVSGGKPLYTELQELITDLNQITTNYKFYSPKQFRDLWIRAGEPVLYYDELDYVDL